jgi:peptidylprolyl isomerase/peptidyl-prolyl cis-trans isomerase B (cyclophilin B)
MNRTSVPVVVAALLLGLVVTASAQSNTPATTPAPAGPQVVVLETTQGKIVIQLNEAKAPKTCANFKKLVKQGFYNGTYFHRVIANFMIQGGDPNTKNALPGDDGLGGPNYTIPAEIGLPHVRGAVATARTGDAGNPAKASSGSQFFIDLAALRSLDQGGYTVFGQVISGMDTVDKIAKFAADVTLPTSAGGGKNPGKKALITKATMEPLANYEKPAATPASTPPAPVATPAAPVTAAPDTAKPDTTQH